MTSEHQTDMNTADPFSQLAQRTDLPSDRVLSALQKEVQADPSPKRSLSRSQRAALSAIALMVGLFATAFNAISSAPQIFLLTAAAFSLSVGGLLFAGAVPGRGEGWDVDMRRTLLAGAVISVFAMLGLQAHHFIPLDEFADKHHFTHAAKCGGHALMAGIMCSAALMMIWKRTDPFSPGLTGAVLGFFGGALGTVSVGLSCGSAEGFHLTVGHGIGTLLLATAGFLLGRKWLTP